MAELADARDLKSRVPNGACGFESRLGYLYFLLRVAVCRKLLFFVGLSPVVGWWLRVQTRQICTVLYRAVKVGFGDLQVVFLGN